MSHEYKKNHHTLTNKKWIIVSSCQSINDLSNKNDGNSTLIQDHYYESKLHCRYEYPNNKDNLWMVPMKYIHCL